MVIIVLDDRKFFINDIIWEKCELDNWTKQLENKQEWIELLDYMLIKAVSYLNIFSLLFYN